MAVVLPQGVVGHQVIVTVHAQGHRVRDVGSPIPAESPLPLRRPVEVTEGHLPVPADGGVDAVHGVIQGLVGGPGSAQDVHLPPQLPGHGAAGELLQLADELHALFLRQEGNCLDGVHQQLHLRQLEGPLSQVIAELPPLDGLHVHAEGLQQPQVVIDAFALGGDPVGGQIGQKLRHPRRVLLIRLLLQVFCQIQQLQLLVPHGSAFLSGFDNSIPAAPAAEQVIFGICESFC